MAGVSSKAPSTPFMDSLQLEAANSWQACPVVGESFQVFSLSISVLADVAVDACTFSRADWRLY